MVINIWVAPIAVLILKKPILILAHTICFVCIVIKYSKKVTELVTNMQT